MIHSITSTKGNFIGSSLLLTREKLLFLFSYDKENGTLSWKNSKRKRDNGKTLSQTHRGYVVVEINNKSFFVHRLIYFIEHNEWPLYTDHINGNKSDNRISNLRSVDSRKNQQNRKSHREGKLVGTYFNKKNKKWISRFKIGNKRFSLGSYLTQVEAHERYKQELKNRGIE